MTNSHQLLLGSPFCSSYITKPLAVFIGCHSQPFVLPANYYFLPYHNQNKPAFLTSYRFQQSARSSLDSVLTKSVCWYTVFGKNNNNRRLSFITYVFVFISKSTYLSSIFFTYFSWITRSFIIKDTIHSLLAKIYVLLRWVSRKSACIGLYHLKVKESSPGTLNFNCIPLFLSIN